VQFDNLGRLIEDIKGALNTFLGGIVMEKWVSLGKRLREFINPETFPVTVKIAKDESQIPPSAKRPLRDLKVLMAPCQGSAMARRYGWTVAFGPDDVGCGIAAHTYGWERLTDDTAAVNFLTRMNYACDEKAAREIIAGLRSLDMGERLTVVYSPLERTKIEPDVILVYVNPAQMMRLIHGATYHTGKSIESSFSGRAGSCTEAVVGAYADNEPKVVVPGNGDRVWATCQDYEMVMAIPAGRLAEVVEGLEKTHEKGIRYPIPAYMRYRPEVAFSMPLSDVFKMEPANTD
jgi:uncharacterized protein (DUF169 family)